MAEAWPVVISGQQLTSFLDIKMVNQKIVDVTANQFYSNDFG